MACNVQRLHTSPLMFTPAIITRQFGISQSRLELGKEGTHLPFFPPCRSLTTRYFSGGAV